jgi:hypothetical protein
MCALSLTRRSCRAIIDKIMQTSDGRLYHQKCFDKRNDGEDQNFKNWMQEFVSRDKSSTSAPAPKQQPSVQHQQQPQPTPMPEVRPLCLQRFHLNQHETSGRRYRYRNRFKHSLHPF